MCHREIAVYMLDDQEIKRCVSLIRFYKKRFMRSQKLYAIYRFYCSIRSIVYTTIMSNKLTFELQYTNDWHCLLSLRQQILVLSEANVSFYYLFTCFLKELVLFGSVALGIYT